MNFQNTKKLLERYQSYFTPELLKDYEVQDRIMSWLNRDISWNYDQHRKPEQEVGRRVMVRDFVGSAKQLLLSLNLRNKEKSKVGKRLLAYAMIGSQFREQHPEIK